VQPDEERYEEFASSMGVNVSSRDFVPFNIANKSFAVNFHKHVLQHIEASGLDFWWLDWQQGEVCVSVCVSVFVAAVCDSLR
jgi:hypothetical protein